MLVEGDQDVHLLNVNLSFLLVHLKSLSLGHFLDHAHLTLRNSAEFDSDSGTSSEKAIRRNSKMPLQLSCSWE